MIPKFRAWDKESQTMYEVKSIIYTLGSMLCVNRSALFPERTLYFEDTPVMQSTGLLDKNGKEIFEGDIVEFEDADDIENVYINQGVIEWCQGGFTVSNRTTVTMDDLLDEDTLEVTIIGNIYENPELVEVNNVDD